MNFLTEVVTDLPAMLTSYLTSTIDLLMEINETFKLEFSDELSKGVQ